MQTRTGNFNIGFRRGGSDWQKDIKSMASWGKSNGFETIDLNMATAEDVQALKAAGLGLGSVDLLKFGEITQPDVGARKALISENVAYVKKAAGLGAKAFFSIVGGEAGKTRAENYKIAVESFAPIAEAAASVGAKIAVEGWPGMPPHYALLCTTPETCRAFFKDIPNGMALNYDPSHLIRLGVDHIRFLKEFAQHVVHVHAKDTELMSDALYEYGLYQSSAFSQGHRWGDAIWRYTLPGHGCARWTEILKILKSANYRGLVSVELEDENFNGTEAGEKSGLLHSLNFMNGA